jgi:hypothetical protein
MTDLYSSSLGEGLFRGGTPWRYLTPTWNSHENARNAQNEFYFVPYVHFCGCYFVGTPLAQATREQMNLR